MELNISNNGNDGDCSKNDFNFLNHGQFLNTTNKSCEKFNKFDITNIDDIKNSDDIKMINNFIHNEISYKLNGIKKEKFEGGIKLNDSNNFLYFIYHDDSGGMIKNYSIYVFNKTILSSNCGLSLRGLQNNIPFADWSIIENYLNGDKNLTLNEIHSFEWKDKNIGSYMMEYVIYFAKKNNCKFIKGYLTSIDVKDYEFDGCTINKNKMDRRNHFYKKFGFEVDCNENGNGCFYLNLEEE